MGWSRRKGRIIAGATIGILAVLVLARLSDFGIWDPWELGAADLARKVATSEPIVVDRPLLTTWLVAQGFSIFGIHEWSGRLPVALAGLLTIFLAYLLTTRFAGRRAGVAAAVVTGTSPLFLFNAREMLGAAPAFAASASVFFCALCAVFAPAPRSTPAPLRWKLRLGWLAGLVVSAALATFGSGALLGVAPPLLGVAVAVAARGELRPPFAERRRAIAGAIVVLAALVVGLGCVYAVGADYAGFGYWTGGIARGGDPPTWEIGIERLFHSFAPWSALLPLALAAMLTPAIGTQGRSEPDAPIVIEHGGEENALRLAVVAWVAFGYLAQTIFTARFGPATFLPLVGVSVAVALFLHDLARSERPYWGPAIMIFLFALLIVRDFRTYPTGPVEGLAGEGIEVPEALKTLWYWEVDSESGLRKIGVWTIFVGLFGLVSALVFASDPSKVRERWSGEAPGKILYDLAVGGPVDLVVKQWRRGGGFRIWLGLAAGLLAALMIFGGICYGAPSLLESSLTSLGVRIGRVALFIPVGLVVGIALIRLALFGLAKLGQDRVALVLGLGVVVGAFASLWYQPALSSQFSPRQVYDTYNELAGANEPLGEFRVGGRAAAYYAEGEIEELDTQPALIEFLRREDRVWVAFRADDLAAVNREYRRHASRHLFVADARSSRMILATNQPVEGRDNQNYLAETVLDEPPQIQHRTSINFDDRIELIGYDLDLPHGDSVGPGQAFTVTWYFRVLAPVSGNYQLFLHIDGPGQRINGDHEPVDGRYPVRLWEAGDVVVDRQRLSVPANYSRGNLTFFLGFYSGSQRLEIKSGPADDVNRARAGILQVR